MVTFGPNQITGHAIVGTARPSAPNALLNAGLVERLEAAVEVVPSGFPGLDALLPAGGIRRGSMYCMHVQEGFAQAGAGALTLACAVACRIAASSTVAGTVVIVDRGTVDRGTVDRGTVDRGIAAAWGGSFHPPAVMPWVVRDSSRQTVRLRGRCDPPPLVIARPSCIDDEIWSIDQALRCPGVAAVVAWPSAVGSRSASSWSVAMRRWQLAARSSGAVGLFVQSDTARQRQSWAEARIAVSPAGRSSGGHAEGGGLLERRLRLELVGGNWAARMASGRSPVSRAVEIVFDLVRGCERVRRDTARVGVSRVDMNRADTNGNHDWSNHDWSSEARRAAR